MLGTACGLPASRRFLHGRRPEAVHKLARSAAADQSALRSGPVDRFCREFDSIAAAHVGRSSASGDGRARVAAQAFGGGPSRILSAASLVFFAVGDRSGLEGSSGAGGRRRQGGHGSCRPT